MSDSETCQGVAITIQIWIIILCSVMVNTIVKERIIPLCSLELMHVLGFLASVVSWCGESIVVLGSPSVESIHSKAIWVHIICCYLIYSLTIRLIIINIVYLWSTQEALINISGEFNSRNHMISKPYVLDSGVIHCASNLIRFLLFKARHKNFKRLVWQYGTNIKGTKWQKPSHYFSQPL